MRKWISVLLIAAMAIGFSACETRQLRTGSSGEDASPVQQEQGSSLQNDDGAEQNKSDKQIEKDVESAVYQLLDAMKSGNSTVMRELVDYEELLQLTDGQSDTNLLAILERMHYSIESISVTGQTAKADVNITNVDMHKVLPDYFKQANTMYYNNALSSSPKSDDVLEREAEALFEDALGYHAADTVDRLAAVELTLENGEWRVQPTESLRSAAFGDFWNAQDLFRENAG